MIQKTQVLGFRFCPTMYQLCNFELKKPLNVLKFSHWNSSVCNMKIIIANVYWIGTTQSVFHILLYNPPRIIFQVDIFWTFWIRNLRHTEIYWFTVSQLDRNGVKIQTQLVLILPLPIKHMMLAFLKAGDWTYDFLTLLILGSKANGLWNEHFPYMISLIKITQT